MELLKILKYLEKKFPAKLTAPWDHSGLQVPIGKLERFNLADTDVAKIGIMLDLTSAIVDQAVADGVNLLISRHPLIFEELKNEQKNPAKKSLLEKLKKEKVFVYTIHSNYDASTHNQLEILLKDQLPLQNLKKIGSHREGYSIKLKKPLKYGEIQTIFEKLFPTPFLLSNWKAVKTQTINQFFLITGAGGGTMIEMQLEKTVLITGELKWHEWLYAQENQVEILALGHHMENYFVSHLVSLLENAFGTSVAVKAYYSPLPYQGAITKNL